MEDILGLHYTVCDAIFEDFELNIQSVPQYIPNCRSSNSQKLNEELTVISKHAAIPSFHFDRIPDQVLCTINDLDLSPDRKQQLLLCLQFSCVFANTEWAEPYGIYCSQHTRSLECLAHHLVSFCCSMYPWFHFHIYSVPKLGVRWSLWDSYFLIFDSFDRRESRFSISVTKLWYHLDTHFLLRTSF